jgi:Flp pilus assembly protein TadB
MFSRGGFKFERGSRFINIVGGFTLLFVGVPLLFLPAPGAAAILLGLAMLAAEYVWARRLLDGVKRQGARLRGALTLIKS